MIFSLFSLLMQYRIGFPVAVYYQLLKKRLNPGGVVSQWLPFYSITPQNFKMIVKSFYKVFPNTSVWFVNSTINAYVIVIGKLDDGMADFAKIEKKLSIPGVKADLAEINSEMRGARRRGR